MLDHVFLLVSIISMKIVRDRLTNLSTQNLFCAQLYRTKAALLCSINFSFNVRLLLSICHRQRICF